MKHLLVTNDFPPKHGGIQSYLWELWRRLPPASTAVLTTPHDGADAFDAEQPFEVERTREPVLLPNPVLARHIDRVADRVGAELVVLDPALPLGLLGPHLSRPYAVVLHGAEVTVPGRLPGTNLLLRRVLRGAVHVIAAGTYPAREGEHAAGRSLPVTVVPPGVDPDRFRPLDAPSRAAARQRLGLPEGRLVVSVSRLVPRKGMDVLIRAVARLARDRPDVTLAIAGAGRDRGRLDKLVADEGAPVAFCGRVPDADLPDLYGCGDVFAMLCRNRWAGLEQEGFGIVFLEAAAAGVPAVAGESGGAAEAVADGETGLVVDPPASVERAAAALAELLDDDERRATMGTAARQRAKREFAYDVLARRLADALDAGPADPRTVTADRIIAASLVGTGAMVVFAVAAVVAPDTLAVPYAALSFVLFLLGCAAFVWAYATAVSRSRTALVSVPGVWFLSGTAPKPVRVRLLGSFGVEVVVALMAAGIQPFTAVAFGVLAPVYGLGLVGLWGARFGDHPPRPDASPGATPAS